MTCTEVSGTQFTAAASYFDPPPPALPNPELSISPSGCDQKISKMARCVLETVVVSSDIGSARRGSDHDTHDEAPQKKIVRKSVEDERKPVEKTTDAVSPKGEEQSAVAAEPKKEAAVVAEKKTEVAPVAEQSRELLFVQIKVRSMLKKLERWKQDYDPAPAFYLGWIPGMSRTVHIESFDVLEAFMTKLGKATTRQKLASILKKNAQIMQESMFCMNTATVAKMTEACSLIEEELKKIGHVDELLQGEKEKKQPAISPQDPLFVYKTRLMEKLGAWNRDFAPQPQSLISVVPGVVDTLANKAKRLFNHLYKGIAKADAREKLTKFLTDYKELISNYSLFVNAATAEKLEAVRDILGAEIAALQQ